MEPGTRAFVCFRLGEGADCGSCSLESGLGEGALLSGDSGFSYIPGSPWEMRSWKQRGGNGWRNGKLEKGGVPEITLLTSQFSIGACPAYLC